jgi:preprotein translocase subunit SecA
MELAENVLEFYLDQTLPPNDSPEDWNLDAFRHELTRLYGFDSSTYREIDWQGLNRLEVRDELWKRIEEKYRQKEEMIGTDLMRTHERIVMLQIVDSQWKDHLYAMDHLKEGIGLRGYGQRDPLIEYKRESFEMFEAMWDRIEEESVRYLFLLQPVIREQAAETVPRPRPARLLFNDPSTSPSSFARRESQGGVDVAVKTVKRSSAKVGRNDPCPCGSGKKYKKCCGA